MVHLVRRVTHLVGGGGWGDQYTPWYSEPGTAVTTAKTSGPMNLPVVIGSRIPIHIGGTLVWHRVTAIDIVDTTWTYRIEAEQ